MADEDPPAYSVRAATPADAQAYRAYLQANLAAHAPWSPQAAADLLDLQRIRALLEPDPQERKVPFVATTSDGLILATCNINNVVRGPFQSAHLGYSVDHRHYRRGIATRTVSHVVDTAFGQLGLHRLEANTLVENAASRALLARLGFTSIGISPRYLHIAGSWQDHVLHALTVEDWHRGD